MTCLARRIYSAPLAWHAAALLGPPVAGPSQLHPLYYQAAHYLLPIFLLASAAAVITSPAAFRLLRHTLRA